jgi:hypothetical protein
MHIHCIIPITTIDYLKHQQSKRAIANPVGYLYQAIVSGWDLSIAQPSGLPDGFNQWFKQMKAQGLVLAAMMDNGIHYTLHRDLDWMPTQQLMQQFPWL